MPPEYPFASAPASHGLPRLSLPAILIICGSNLLLYFLAANHYGYFRDELYFLDCGRHLDWGYVDHAPLVAVYCRIALALGGSLWALRGLSYLSGMIRIILTIGLTRRLGGGSYAQWLAGLCVFLTPMYLGTDSILTMNCFESVFWMGCVYILLLIMQTGNSRLWLWFGLIAGLGLENKHSTLFFGAALVAGLILTPLRRELLKPWIYLGGLVALAVFLPNIWWQIQHHFPTYELLQNVKNSGKNVEHSPLSFFLEQILVMNPLLSLLWLIGLFSLFFGRLTRYRILGWIYIFLLIIFIVMQGKNYYISPAYPMLIAAGAVTIDLWMGARRSQTQMQMQSNSHPQALWPRVIVLALAASGFLLVPAVTPMLPIEQHVAYAQALHVTAPKTEVSHDGPLPQLFGDQFGWPELVSEVATAYNALPPEQRAHTGIFANNYGEAGALAMFGPRYGLPQPLSGHQTYYYWGPPSQNYTDWIVLQDDRETLESKCAAVDLLFEHYNKWGMAEENGPVYLCHGINFDLRDPAAWAKLKKWR